MAKKRKRQPHVRGKTEIVDLTKLRPNGWNGNTMTELERESMKAGFMKEGWLVSQALLVWHTDEKGEERNVIIDGEQRWTCALDVGLLKGPAVYLDGIAEDEARRLTVQLYTRRGSWTDEALAAALRPIELDVSDALDLGFEEERLTALLELEPPPENDERKKKRKRPEGGGEVPAMFAIVIECVDEFDQTAKLNELMERGWKCRALI